MSFLPLLPSYTKEDISKDLRMLVIKQLKVAIDFHSKKKNSTEETQHMFGTT